MYSFVAEFLASPQPGHFNHFSVRQRSFLLLKKLRFILCNEVLEPDLWREAWWKSDWFSTNFPDTVMSSLSLAYVSSYVSCS